jgi:hypothetical protein
MTYPSPMQKPIIFWPPFLLRLQERGLIGTPPLQINHQMQIHEMSYNDMAAEFDNMLRTLALIIKLNSQGKTKEIADEIRPILEHYNRNQD